MTRLLESTVGDRRLAVTLIEAALARGSKAAVARFAQTSLCSAISAALGPEAAARFTEALGPALDQAPTAPARSAASPASRGLSSIPAASEVQTNPRAARPTNPPSMVRRKQPSLSGAPGRLSVVVLLSDPLARSWTARTLIRGGVDVCSGDGISELLRLMPAGAAHPDLAVVDLECENSDALLAVLDEYHPALPVVVWAQDAEAARRAVSRTSLKLLHVHANDRPLQELAERVLGHSTGLQPPPMPALDGVPRLLVVPADLERFELDARARRFAEAVDGRLDLAALAPLCGMEPLDTQWVAWSLVHQGVLAIS